MQTQMTQKPMPRAEVYARALHASQNCKENSAYKVLLRLLRNKFFCILYLPVSLLMPDPRSLFQNKTNEDR